MRKILLAIFIPALVCLLVSVAGATGKHYTLISGERDLYYGFISYLPEEIGSRAPEVIRNGLKPEPVRLNFPVGPGDLIVTYDRPCEIQFDSGTILRLDTDTRLRIETIMAQSLSSEEQMSNLWLERGQAYLMYTAYNSWEVFQLLTPNAAIKMKNKSVLMVRHTGEGETWLTVKEGKVSVLYGPSASRLSTVSARKGVSLVVDASHQVSARDNFPEFAQFEAWNAGLNKKFLELHKGITPLPKPVQKLPPAVFYFAQYYGNRYGEWLWDDYLGYVWRPFYNDLYPWGNWSPYFYGSWTYLNGQLFWVPEEPWGWVPYHLGIWHWDKKKGWVWIPGSVFAPAWAVWDFYFGYYTWRPWFLYDWLGLYGYDYNYWNYWGYYGGGGGSGSGSEIPAITKVSRDQLKKPRTQTPPVPAEYKKIVTGIARAIERRDAEILKRISEKPPAPVAVKPEDLGTEISASRILKLTEVMEKVNPGETATLSKGKSEILPALDRAISVYLKNRAGEEIQVRNTAAAGIKEEMSPARMAQRASEEIKERRDAAGMGEHKPGRPGAVSSPEYSLRFRDWNPDLKAARQLGVNIFYDSTKNLIVSPELRLTSREARELRVRITPQGIVQLAPAIGFSGSSSATGSSSAAAPSTGSSSRSSSEARSAGAERSSGGKASNSSNEKH